MIAPTPYFSDRGCHVRIFEEARGLIEQGDFVRIVAYHLGRDIPPVPVDRIINIPWYSKTEAGPSWQKIFLDILLLFKALMVAFRFKPDIVHAHLHEGAVLGWVLSRLFRIPLLFDYQGSLTGECLSHGFFAPSSLMCGVFSWIERCINSLADHIVTSSSPALNDLLSSNGGQKYRLTPLPDGVDTDRFSPYSKRDARERLGIQNESPLVVYLGLTNRYQGIDLMLDAASKLVDRKIGFHLVIMGFPEEEYRKKAQEMNLSDFVTFTGRVDYAEAPLLLSAGVIAVSPKISDTEANGKLLNYMACGLPVVAFDTPVNRELLGEDGVYARFGDSEDLSRCLGMLLADNELIERKGLAMRQRAIGVHSWIERLRLLRLTYLDILHIEKNKRV